MVGWIVRLGNRLAVDRQLSPYRLREALGPMAIHPPTVPEIDIEDAEIGDIAQINTRLSIARRSPYRSPRPAENSILCAPIASLISTRRPRIRVFSLYR